LGAKLRPERKKFETRLVLELLYGLVVCLVTPSDEEMLPATRGREARRRAVLLERQRG
jgi:hypothetical protein